MARCDKGVTKINVKGTHAVGHTARFYTAKPPANENTSNPRAVPNATNQSRTRRNVDYMHRTKQEQTVTYRPRRRQYLLGPSRMVRNEMRHVVHDSSVAHPYRPSVPAVVLGDVGRSVDREHFQRGSVVADVSGARRGRLGRGARVRDGGGGGSTAEEELGGDDDDDDDGDGDEDDDDESRNGIAVAAEEDASVPVAEEEEKSRAEEAATAAVDAAAAAAVAPLPTLLRSHCPPLCEDDDVPLCCDEWSSDRRVAKAAAAAVPRRRTSTAARDREGTAAAARDAETKLRIMMYCSGGYE
eukprot:CAMPEP_0197435104 /NCGR_PEP_ID=MMETSP1175-20131217/2744_2 /TAXON_ID=1003142 /ORGANISM="Triceratium dubium, Strain CCMP147" /LENGTH=298 /DNA_ID=CAMNT_0042964047 /DNA_START=499 /DNA_END=1396 /DNA_ORIENTATION=-